MHYLSAIKILLDKIERSYASERTTAIAELQNKIWDEPGTENEDITYMLDVLAGDLNFYEPIERDRDEALGYYGDEKLTQLINDTRLKLEEHLANKQ